VRPAAPWRFRSFFLGWFQPGDQVAAAKLNSVECFRTSRLTAERLRESHLEDLVTLHLDPEVSRYLGGVRSPEATKTYLTVNIAHWNQHGSGLWVLRTQTGEFAGRAGIRHVVVDGAEEVEIVYTLKRTLWGQGLASEIVNVLTGIGLSKFKLSSLVGLVSVENRPSRRVLEKSHFTVERRAMYHGEEIMIYRSPIASAVPG
jgi:RimJ/RimL family protein N-acetyltransferase